MWLFSKKKQEGILPPLPVPKAPAVNADEIELIPEDLPEIPSEVPSLDFKKQTIAIPQKEMTEPSMMTVIPATRVVAMRAVKETASKFIKTETHQNVVLGINEINNDFDLMNIEVERVIELKGSRDQKIDSMQTTLEEVGKKMLEMDQIMFGGQ